MAGTPTFSGYPNQLPWFVLVRLTGKHPLAACNAHRATAKFGNDQHETHVAPITGFEL
jgi:hypothetical protein